jgi:hypothetical protein
MTLITAPPAGITTLEQYAAWAGLALASINSQLIAVEGELLDDKGARVRELTERACQANVFTIPHTGELRMILRQSFTISPEYFSGGRRNWMYVEEFVGSAELPVGFV